jgi:oligoribonuclease
MDDAKKNTTPTKLLWVDLEMTGLDPVKDRIVEIAIEVTDFNFDVLDRYEAVIYQSEDVIKNMNPWAAAQHSASGLTAKIRSSKKTEEKVIGEVVGLITAQFGDEPAILAGNSIWNDRNFIRKWWPEVDALLHYRMVDVSSLKIIMQGKYGYVHEKDSSHRALDDIQASITELKDYIKKLRHGS